MLTLIGTDEAGYAPNLGPLVISATVWELDSPGEGNCLYERLRDVVTCEVPLRSGDPRVAWADSKVVYTPAQGLRLLERGVLAALGLMDQMAVDWPQMWRLLAPESIVDLEAAPWYAGYRAPLPLAADGGDVRRATEMLTSGFRTAGVRLKAVRSRAVFPLQFNDLVERHGTKGEALSRLTLQLIGNLLPDDGPVSIVCDKHGGRNRYSRLLQEQFPESLVEVHGEGRAESVYRFRADQRRVECRFCCGAESFLPVALASMASKYLRELAMRAFNDYWRRLVPDLAPTAGYPLDARRFKRQITEVQTRLGVDDRLLWRER